MRATYTLLFFVLCLPLPAQDCGFDDCEILRGDADCSGDLDVSDVVAIATSSYNNADAADVDDDGDVDGDDATHLFDYLFSNGANPAAPFPSVGFDCTADTLEECCSKQTGTFDPSMDEYSVDVTLDEWDNSSDESMHVWNGPSCVHDEVSNVYDTEVQIDDTTGFTYYRLSSGVQGINLTTAVFAGFTWNWECDTSCEEEINTMFVDLTEASLVIEYTQGTSLKQLEILASALDFGGDESMFFNYARFEDESDCNVTVILGDYTQDKDAGNELTALFLDNMDENCDLATITAITIEEVSLNLYVGDHDVVKTEAIQAYVDFDVVYDFCQ